MFVSISCCRSLILLHVPAKAFCSARASRSQWRLPVVAALHDVQRLAVEVDARAAGHGGSLQPPGK